jgi:hypothetical protein
MHTQVAESLRVASQPGRVAERAAPSTSRRIAPTFLVPDALCTSAQTVTVPPVRIVVRRESGEDHMLFIVGIVIALIAVVIIPRMRVPDGVNSANLGWMSEQWLAEHRASHSL